MPDPVLDEGDAFEGAIVFDSEAPLLPGDEDDGWFTYRPSGTVRLRSAGHVWSNVPRQDRFFCSVDMHAGWLEVLLQCPVGTDGLAPGFVMMRWTNLSGPAPRGVPYPLGPFQPDTFREQETFIDFRFFQDDGSLIAAAPTLDAVKFVEEPAVFYLFLAGTISLLMAHQRQEPSRRQRKR